MSLWTKLLIILKVIFSRHVNASDNPLPRLDEPLEKQRDLLARAQSGLIDIATSRTRLEQQSRKLHARLPRLEDQASAALAAGHEDQARLAIKRRLATESELELLDRHLAEITEEEHRMTGAVLGLAARVDGFALRYDIAAARFLVADSGGSIRAALRSIDGDIADLTTRVCQAEERTRQMDDRAAALDALMETEIHLRLGVTPAERALNRLYDEQAIESYLAGLKTYLAQTHGKE
ncbi:MAG TPA: PspA/IM30 family protein [Aggregatilineaceae bacterium]|nr:PspA/IM30 family protein [Aggregatilineaceae bacterium]